MPENKPFVHPFEVWVKDDLLDLVYEFAVDIAGDTTEVFMGPLDVLTAQQREQLRQTFNALAFVIWRESRRLGDHGPGPVANEQNDLPW